MGPIVGIVVGLLGLGGWVDGNGFRERAVKVEIAGALVLGEGLMGVGPFRFTSAALAPYPTVPVVVKVMARDIQRSGSV